MQHRFSRRAVSALVMSLACTAAHAQTATDGAIGGTVTDVQEAAIGGALIVVHNNSTNAESTITADGSGYFRALHLDPGTYNVTITAPSFQTYKSTNVIVQVGVLTPLNPRMVVGSQEQQVQVTDVAPIINTTSPASSGRKRSTTCLRTTTAGPRSRCLRPASSTTPTASAC